MRRGAATGWFLAGLNTVFLSVQRCRHLCSPLPRRRKQIQAGLDRNLKTAQWMLAYDHAAWVHHRFAGQGRQGSGEKRSARFGSAWKKTTCGTRCTVATNQTPSRRCSAIAKFSPDSFGRWKAPDFPDRDRFARAINLTLPEIEDTTRKTNRSFQLLRPW